MKSVQFHFLPLEAGCGKETLSVLAFNFLRDFYGERYRHFSGSETENVAGVVAEIEAI